MLGSPDGVVYVSASAPSWRQPFGEVRRLVANFITKRRRSRADRLTNKGALAYQQGNYELALRHLREAAVAGVPTANYNLGIAHAEGRAVPPDESAALHYFERAAEQNHAPAAFALGEAFRKGIGVSEHPFEAARWYRVAAEHGDFKAANELGLLMIEGRGMPKDVVEGFAWIFVGTHQSIQYEPSFKNAMQLATLLTKEEVIKAQERGTEYFKDFILPYQQRKASWLRFLRRAGASCLIIAATYGILSLLRSLFGIMVCSIRSGSCF